MKNHLSIIALCLFWNIANGQHINESSTSFSGNLYHTGGEVGIGVTSPTRMLEIEGSGSSHDGIEINNTSSGNPRIKFQYNDVTKFTIGVDNSDGDKFKIGTTALETGTSFCITSAGYIGIGTTSPSYRLTVYEQNASSFLSLMHNDGNQAAYNGIIIQCGTDAGTGIPVYINAEDGDGTSIGKLRHSNGTFMVLDMSDLRTKANINPTALTGLETINNLRVVDFNRKSNPNGKTIRGFIAQEVQEVYPHPVSKDHKTGLLALSYTEFVPLLVKACQEQNEIIEKEDTLLDTELQKLNDISMQISELSTRINQLSQ